MAGSALLLVLEAWKVLLEARANPEPEGFLLCLWVKHNWRGPKILFRKAVFSEDSQIASHFLSLQGGVAPFWKDVPFEHSPAWAALWIKTHSRLPGVGLPGNLHGALLPSSGKVMLKAPDCLLPQLGIPRKGLETVGGPMAGRRDSFMRGLRDSTVCETSRKSCTG